jgi:hypothetical protein
LSIDIDESSRLLVRYDEEDLHQADQAFNVIAHDIIFSSPYASP